MALEREDAPFHVSHWGAEDTLTTPHKIQETGFELGELLLCPSCSYQACRTGHFPCYSRFVGGIFRGSVNNTQKLTPFAELASKDSVMSDETTSASAIDVQMILEDDGLYLRESLPQPSVVVPLAATQEDEPNTEGLPGKLKS
jgi:hypothetical protein